MPILQPGSNHPQERSVENLWPFRTSSAIGRKIRAAARKKIPFDQVIKTFAGLGVSGLVLLVAMAVFGWPGRQL
jgi:hypothetical protein